MSVTVSFSHNVEDVISDIETVQYKLEDELRSRVNAAMNVVVNSVRHYITKDPHVSGDLRESVFKINRQTDDGRRYGVATRKRVAPYAAVTEYGSGERSNVRHESSNRMPTRPSHRKPPGYPYESPDIQNLSGFAYYIEEWMREKGLQPEKYDSVEAASFAIAKTIDDQGTYAHPYFRPAWFENEYKVKEAARSAVHEAVN